jgi:predicted DNA-binding transcriptional regulator AlpA
LPSFSRPLEEGWNMQTATLPEVVTLQQLCERFEVTRQTINNWVQAEVLPPPVRLGRRVYWLPEQIERVLLKRTK